MPSSIRTIPSAPDSHRSLLTSRLVAQEGSRRLCPQSLLEWGHHRRSGIGARQAPHPTPKATDFTKYDTIATRSVNP